jgi:hypothetical protein
MFEDEVAEEHISETDDILEGDISDEDYKVLAATGQPQTRNNSDKKVVAGCFNQFIKGVCESRSRCTFDHSPEAMTGLIKFKIRQVVNAKCKHTLTDNQIREFLEEYFKVKSQRGAGTA